MIVQQIHAATTRAYMYEVFGEGHWVGIIETLLEAGYTADQTEWILLSKHIRWADDIVGRVLGGRRMMQKYLEDERNKNSIAESLLTL